MTRTCFTVPGDGATVQQIVEAAATLPLAAYVAWRALESRPGTRFEELLAMRTNIKLLGDGARWSREDLATIEKLEVVA